MPRKAKTANSGDLPFRVYSRQEKGSVSLPAAATLDLIRYARSIGGFNRVLTVPQELGESMDTAKLIGAVKAEGTLVCAQRLGWLLKISGYAALVKELAGFMGDRNPPIPCRIFGKVEVDRFEKILSFN